MQKVLQRCGLINRLPLSLLYLTHPHTRTHTHTHTNGKSSCHAMWTCPIWSHFQWPLGGCQNLGVVNGLKNKTTNALNSQKCDATDFCQTWTPKQSWLKDYQHLSWNVVLMNTFFHNSLWCAIAKFIHSVQYYNLLNNNQVDSLMGQNNM